MHARISASLKLEHIVVAVLALAAGGCCLGVEEQPWSDDISGTIADEDLEDVRNSSSAAEDRCKTACAVIAQQMGIQHEGQEVGQSNVTMCEATPVDMQPGGPTDPWDESYTQVMIDCHAEGTFVPFCTGRRPLGHCEAPLAVASRGSWFAVHAHLERASITAFEQLADWLAERGAPRQLVERCHVARRDELVHAELMTTQAVRAGAEVPATELEPAATDMLEVAIHNAVEGCVSEAFAAVVAAHQARHAESAELRELFGQIAADELRHGQLAWDVHAWLLSQLSEQQRAQVLETQAAALAELPSAARRGATVTPAGLGWPAPELAAAMAREFAARITAASLDAHAA